jgi:acid phosphatase type 7
MWPLSLLLAVQAPVSGLAVKPYVTLGEQFSEGPAVVWHVSDESRRWALRYRHDQSDWRPATIASDRPVRARGVPNHRVIQATLRGIPAGAKVDYQIVKDGATAFSASFTAPKSPNQAFRFAAYGDIGRNTAGQKRIAFQVARQRPDFQVLLGDMVYAHGRMSEYRTNFFPIENHDVADPARGAPLLRTTLTVPVKGNHDTAYRDLGRYPDGLAFYAYWPSPGGGPKRAHNIRGNTTALAAASGGTLETAGNYAFRYGNSHWVVLDTNHYVNWRTPSLRQWLDRTLSEGADATWRFVAFHVPPYSGTRRHASDTSTRVLTDLFTKHKVDLVFSGHIHNYQRTYPMRANGNTWQLDKAFNGNSRTRADGTIYVISGAGGAELYDQAQVNNPRTWQPFTAKVLGGHSFTIVDVEDRRLTLRQIDAQGREIDRIALSK